MPFDAVPPHQEATGQMESGRGDAVPAAPVISVIIPTFHRPEGALAAVRSVFEQTGAPAFEVLLVDNDAGRSAEAAADTLAAESPVPFRYAVEPAAGVASARNTAVALARGAFIAFLDDDEVARPQWLAHLIATQAQTGADVVFGPIEARLPPGADQPHSYFKTFFSRLLEGPTRVVDKPYGCGNSLLRRETVLHDPVPFNPATNETGGEDDLLWQDVRARGGTFAWAAEAWVWEDVPASRATWGYLTRRGFAYGHNTTAQLFEASQPQPVKGVVMMARGAVQALLMAPVFVALWLTRHERRAWAYDKMLRGLGKVFWFGPFKQGFYGAAAVKTRKAAQPG